MVEVVRIIGNELEEYDSIPSEVKSLWALVTNNVSDFSSWTSLLSIVEKDELPREAARFIFDTYLKRFSLCFGYWKKFADLEKKWSLESRTIEIYEKGVLNIPLSVDLWIYYINHSIQSKSPYQIIKSLYNRAIEKCGGEFKSDKLWDMYIDFEKQNNQMRNCLEILTLSIKTITQSLPKRFDDLRKLIETNSVEKFLDSDLCKVYVDQFNELDVHINIEISFEEYVRNSLLQEYKSNFDRTMIEYNKRLEFENLIKRPYFHIKPLDEFQILNWHKYIDYEIDIYKKNNDSDQLNRINLIFDRCLIPCAHYEEFWKKAIEYYSSRNNVEKVKELYSIVCSKHLIENVQLKLDWSSFVYKQNDVELSKLILETVEGQTQGTLLARMKLINLIRITEYNSNIKQNHSSNNDVKIELVTSLKIIDHFLSYLKTSKGEYNISFYAIKLTNFIRRYLGDNDKVRGIFWETLSISKGLKRVYLQFFNSEISNKIIDFFEVKKIVNMVLEDDALDTLFKQRFLQRYLEIIEDNCFDENLIDETINFFNEKIRILQSSNFMVDSFNNTYVSSENVSHLSDGSLKRHNDIRNENYNCKVPCTNTNQIYEINSYTGTGSAPIVNSQTNMNMINNQQTAQWDQFQQNAYFNWYQQYGGYNPSVNQ